MQRLALVVNGKLLPAPKSNSEESQRSRADLRTAFSFGLGVLASGVVGGVALLGLQALAAGQMSAQSNPSVAAAIVAKPVNREAEPVAFDVTIDRSERARAPFGLRVTGTDDANLEIIVSGVPPGAWLSRGERRDARTWALRRADLNDLHLTLDDGTPDAFDVRIEVAPPPGMATLSSVVRVHVVEASSNGPSTATIEDRPADPAQAHTKVTVSTGPVDTPVPTQAPTDSRTAGAGSDEKAARPPAQRRVAPTAADASALASQAAPPPQPRPWPEGASALGAVSRESERQVWWTMPPPSWSPFQDAADRP